MNGEHLSPTTRELLDKPIEERIAHIQKDSWIPYSQANKILQQLEDLLQHPKCDRMPNLAISAQTNNGKTRLMKHFLSLHQASETSSGRSRRQSSMCKALAFPKNRGCTVPSC
jgi:hypothetical protein